jgi:tape measure domain-containing protein
MFELLEAFVTVRLKTDKMRADLTALRNRLASAKTNLDIGVPRGAINNANNAFRRLGSAIAQVPLAPFRIAMSALFITIRQLAQQIILLPFRALGEGLRGLFSPILAVVQGLRQLIAFAPQIALVFGGLAVRNLVQFQIAMERINATMRFAFGRDTQSQIEFVNKLASDLGLVAVDSARQFSTLSASMLQTGATVRETQDLFRGMASAIVVLSRSPEEAKNSFKALEQVFSKGRLTAEELRGQLGEALPGAVAIAARAFGVTTARLEQLTKTGQITAQEFGKVFSAELIRTFGNEAGRASARLEGRLNALRNRFDEVRATLASLVAAPVVKFVETLVNAFQQVGGIEKIRAAVANLVSILQVATAAISRNGTSLKAAFNAAASGLETMVSFMITVNTIGVAAFVSVLNKARELASPVLKNVNRFIKDSFGVTRIDTFNQAISFAVGLMTNLGDATDLIGLKFDQAILKAQSKLNELRTNFIEFLNIQSTGFLERLLLPELERLAGNLKRIQDDTNEKNRDDIKANQDLIDKLETKLRTNIPAAMAEFNTERIFNNIANPLVRGIRQAIAFLTEGAGVAGQAFAQQARRGLVEAPDAVLRGSVEERSLQARISANAQNQQLAVEHQQLNVQRDSFIALENIAAGVAKLVTKPSERASVALNLVDLLIPGL